MKKLITFFAWNLEAHERPALSRNDWLEAFTAMDNSPNFHMSLPELCLLFPAGQFIPQNLQMLAFRTMPTTGELPFPYAR
jgi:hypothetical protein